MKIIITETQYQKVVDEVSIENKNKLGRGMSHDVYYSKTNPNIVYKVGHEYTISYFEKMINTYPELFPKLYGKRKLKNNDNSGFLDDVYFLILERLNTEKFVSLGQRLFKIMHKHQFFFSFREFADFKNVREYINKEEDGELYDFTIKLYNFLYKMMEMMGKGQFIGLDLHLYNFGFDENGDIKCLDL